MIDDTTASNQEVSEDTTASPPKNKSSWYLSTVEKIEAGLKYHIQEAQKFVDTQPEDRTKEGAKKYQHDCEMIAELWSRIPRKRRRQLNPNRFSNRYKKYLTFKTLQDNNDAAE